MLLISRSFVPSPTWWVQVGAPRLKKLCLRFNGDNSMNQFRCKLTIVRVMFPSPSCRLICWWCWNWYALKLQILQAPVENKCIPSSRSQVMLGLNLNFTANTLHTPICGPNMISWGVFRWHQRVCWLMSPWENTCPARDTKNEKRNLPVSKPPPL